MRTMKDVAAAAGVSISTVSLVLSGRGDGRITPEVSDRVRRIAKDLGYVPNLLAKGLRTRQTHTIGLLSDSVASTPFSGTMLAAAQRTAWDAGYLLLLIDTADTRELEGPATQALLQRNVEGLIYASMYHRDVELPEVPRGLPLVLLDGRPKTEGVADWIVPDERGGAHAAVRALVEAGHDRIAFCNNAEDIPASRERLQGFREALQEAGITYSHDLVVDAASSTAEAGRRAVTELLIRERRPTGLFCFSDRIAMGAYQAAQELGLRIPSDLSIVGFDDQESVADALRPGLTTIALPHVYMGRWAARRIIRRLQSTDVLSPTSQLAPCEIVSRGSIAGPRDLQ